MPRRVEDLENSEGNTALYLHPSPQGAFSFRPLWRCRHNHQGPCIILKLGSVPDIPPPQLIPY